MPPPNARARLGRRGLIAIVASGVAAPALVRAQSQSGAALVIGNSKYLWEASLPNAKRDAVDLAKCFEGMGLKTELLQDAGRQAMEAAFEKFGNASHGADLACFYFAGHGVALATNNYLVPVDSDLTDPRTVPTLIPIRAVAGAMADSKARLLVFDNCRNNPSDGWRQQEALDRAKGSGQTQQGDGTKLPRNTSILYSTAPGRAALDGRAGENSPFANILLRRLSAKSVDLFYLNPQLRRDLLIETEGRQLVWSAHTFPKSYTIAGSGMPLAKMRPRVVASSRIVELKNAYAYAKEIKSTIPFGIVAICPPEGSSGAQFIGSYKFSGRDGVPYLLVVVAVTDDRTAEIILAWLDKGRPTWRYLSAKLSKDTLDAQTWAVGEQFAFRWRERDSGSVTIFPPPNSGGRGIMTGATMPFNGSFTRLDG